MDSTYIFKKYSRHGKEDVNSLKRKSSVNQEYKDAFRTKSYTELCDKAQNQLEIRKCLDKGQSFSSSSPISSPYSPSHINHVHLSEYLLDPPPETLTPILEDSNLHRFLIDYLNTSHEAGRVCEFVLQNIRQVDVNYRAIKNIIKLIELYPDCTSWTDNQYDTLYRNLASFAAHNNPFSSTPEKLFELHDTHVHLLHQLTSQCRKTKRRTKFFKYIKRGLATFLAVGAGAIAVALLVLALHSMVGMVATPGLIACCLGLFKIKKSKRRIQEFKRTGLEETQLDIAARGVYTLINDFDTMGQLVKGLHNEMESRRFVAEICVQKGKNEILKEVVKEFQMNESCFLEQLEELKKHVYLCFLNINRSRRLLVQEINEK
ncbi:hypothetical protein DH2020_007432 [Rehmannia glutinosa]|uniref:Uncharacterized protein n=1 Tax=Rehmannia glutinosa TaxID=99300 RepID=A0ABR0TY47_REHGL